ncbi:hypothetical protein N7478_011550 [Penicillium angulare]|uniref:uncharacterized protein n=1 Tax=Penicillium angulare TaxID=116970 RepID=UPI0025422E9E|nr:uncharacterized protein N7478_011550 [Penicillium angulare]KAJ5263945.1 hypothetical protein N7478_011550 [Penicillium angulare]
MLGGIYGNSENQNGQQGSHFWLPSHLDWEYERTWDPAAAAAARMDMGWNDGSGTRNSRQDARVALDGEAVVFGTRDAKTAHGERAA